MGKYDELYYKELARIKRFIKQAEKKGFSFNYQIPQTPQRIRPQSVQRLRNITPILLYSKATYKDTTGLTYSPKQLAAQTDRDIPTGSRALQNAVRRARRQLAIEEARHAPRTEAQKQAARENIKKAQEARKQSAPKARKQSEPKAKTTNQTQRVKKPRTEAQIRAARENIKKAQEANRLKRQAKIVDFTKTVINNFMTELKDLNKETTKGIQYLIDTLELLNSRYGDEVTADVILQITQDTDWLDFSKRYQIWYDESEAKALLSRIMGSIESITNAKIPLADLLETEELFEAASEFETETNDEYWEYVNNPYGYNPYT